MPIIQGMCIPPVCVTIAFNTNAVTVQVFDKKKGAVDPKRTGIAVFTGAGAPNVAAYRARLANPIVFGCDACTCNKGPLQGPFDMPDEDVPPAQRYQLQITGATYTIQWGTCEPPKKAAKAPGGAKKAGKKAVQKGGPKKGTQTAGRRRRRQTLDVGSTR